ncbi:hypothetical protein FHL15_000418 [Xylaria flabelliformis]|uniref:Uncharacterized protein n=1 Tax=Xylaria flabelliformis TaxID=2512241 RepID=A0A553IFU8_9PEZI|nr:hypothetical protein FHL15_000418 [Xylaria flabelliformis]
MRLYAIIAVIYPRGYLHESLLYNEVNLESSDLHTSHYCLAFGYETLFSSPRVRKWCPKLPGYLSLVTLSIYKKLDDMSHSEDIILAAEEAASMSDDDSFLSEYLCIGSRVQLRLYMDGEDFTDEFHHIIYHREGEILGLLQKRWPVIEEHISNHPLLRDQIANRIYFRLPCYGGTKLWRLNQTYLPLSNLKTRFSQYAEDDTKEYFPFLDIQGTIAPDDFSAWKFLRDNFGVGNSDTLRFYLDVLSVIKGDSTPYQKVFELYQVIQEKVISSDNVVAARELVRSYFEEFGLIMVPRKQDRWERPKFCRWNGTKDMVFTGLESAYEEIFEKNRTWESTLIPFMRETVGVKDMSSSDIVSGIRTQKMLVNSRKAYRKEEGIEWDGMQETVFRDWFYRLAGMKADLTPEDRAKLQESFSTEELILVAEKWYTLSDCLWSNTINSPGMAILNTDWSSFGTFFTGFLGVQKVEEEIIVQLYPDRHAGGRKRKRIGAGESSVLTSSDYVRLLNTVIRAARAVDLRHLANSDMSLMGAAFENGDNYHFELPPNTRNLKNLVFEVLSRGLPSFTEANWQSNIRRYVNVHPEYAGMEDWDGNETADFVYCDHESALTNLLIQKQYLDETEWSGRRPIYYIEVKTTRGPCKPSINCAIRVDPGSTNTLKPTAMQYSMVTRRSD